MRLSTLPQRIETVVIGAGQAGLAISYHLSRAGRAHLVLEKAAQLANAWRNQRWDSFTLVTPNFQVRMPGAEYAGPEPYGFMSRAQIIEYLEAYAARFQLPIRCGVEVRGVERLSGAYRLATSAGTLRAENVVVATGLYQAAKIPHFSVAFPAGIRQLHSMQYRNPESLPPGAILVIGTGQSGAQIAEELYQSGRKVFLSIGRAGRAPRRYRGRDISDWLTRMGLFDTKVQDLKSAAEKFAANPQISGKNGGESLNLHQFAHDGVRLLGHVYGCSAGQLLIAPDLHETLAEVDQFEIDLLRQIDEYIVRAGLSAPTETLQQLRYGYAQPQITELNLTAHGIGTVLWATGYAFDFSLVRLPILDADGYPIQARGVTRFDGLYFLGMPWLYSRRSGLLFGVRMPPFLRSTSRPALRASRHCHHERPDENPPPGHCSGRLRAALVTFSTRLDGHGVRRPRVRDHDYTPATARDIDRATSDARRFPQRSAQGDRRRDCRIGNQRL